MLNPLHLAFTVLSRMLDLLVPRPRARSGRAVPYELTRAPRRSDARRPG
jgi:hypothetical protein